mmetsp:Transcript_2862/g.3797  ORF Transcript_2862/g.3797 Transcript_2862/m.3797 type:complete len:425 (+) Transcript_2862:182-1456(+)|eukprot:CAMPEP_0168540272 /NCGR_PEP_ID=MMETSP0413-20121227/185_1 /TAXON_ID=136452 /ORGANISM="Filamoeba nolandi, Strain NC-AS-23-1" /LENGTH=424 /DNA_ID=CAMNT_0008569989 /DNA_START=140 /DNA_END=1414 /DNA_ORIENTATION=-
MDVEDANNADKKRRAEEQTSSLPLRKRFLQTHADSSNRPNSSSNPPSPPEPTIGKQLNGVPTVKNEPVKVESKSPDSSPSNELINIETVSEEERDAKEPDSPRSPIGSNGNKKRPRTKQMKREKVDTSLLLSYALPPRKAAEQSRQTLGKMKKVEPEEEEHSSDSESDAEPEEYDSDEEPKSPQIEGKKKTYPSRGRRSTRKKEEPVYCICRKPDIPGQLMIACDMCDEWFHGKCVGITQKQAEKITKYVCDTCSGTKKTPSSTNDNNDVSARQPKCFSKSCFNAAKPNSKYCSDECGIKTAKEALKQREVSQKLNQLSTVTQELFSAADAEDQRLLEAIAKRKQQLENNIREVEHQEKDLERHITVSQTLYAKDPVAAEASTDLRLATLEIVDCITCSQPIPAKNYAKHVQQCFVKKRPQELQ